MKNWLHDPIHFAPIAKLGGGWIAFKDSPSPPPAPVPTTVMPKPPTINGMRDFVESMTIAEARAMWVELNKMFGEKA